MLIDSRASKFVRKNSKTGKPKNSASLKEIIEKNDED
jgi:hypothetical protein